MGVIKAILTLAFSIIASDIFLKILEKHKSKPGLSIIAPYINNRAHSIIFIMVLIMILL
jgi:hypothetical protein